MSDKKLRGGVLKSYLKFINHQWGKEGVARCEQEIGISLDRLQEEKLYSLELDEAILTWVAKNKGEEHLGRMGNFTVKNLGALSYLVRFANMKFLLRKAKENYEDTFTYGRVSVLMDEMGKRATVILKDSNNIRESCMVWLGAFEGMLEVTRTNGSVTETKCQVAGDDFCEFLIKWE